MQSLPSYHQACRNLAPLPWPRGFTSEELRMQVQFPGPTWWVTNFCNSNCRGSLPVSTGTSHTHDTYILQACKIKIRWAVMVHIFNHFKPALESLVYRRSLRTAKALRETLSWKNKINKQENTTQQVWPFVRRPEGQMIRLIHSAELRSRKNFQGCQF